MATTQNWNRRGLAGPLCTIMIMAVMGLAALWLARPVAAKGAQTAPVVTDDARKDLEQATAALRRVASVKTIPAAVADKALGVAVFGNLVKGAFIATEAAGSLALYISKALTFRQFGALPTDIIIKGLISGSSVMAGTYTARLIVERLSVAAFQHILDIVMVVSGLALLWQALR